MVTTEVSKTTQAIATALSNPMELHRKILLLEAPHIPVAKCRETYFNLAGQILFLARLHSAIVAHFVSYSIETFFFNVSVSQTCLALYQYTYCCLDGFRKVLCNKE